MFGPHSYITDEAAKSSNRGGWRGSTAGRTILSLLDVPLKELPTMTQDQVWELLAAFEELAKAAGWSRANAA